LAEDGYDTEWSPPKPYIYRMWASGSIVWSRNEILTQQKVSMVTRCTNVTPKQSTRGASVFVTVEKKTSNEFGLCVTETRTLVYLSSKPTQGRDLRRQTVPDFTIVVKPNTISLFRFSALTYNSHKIHYDQAYALEEGYKAPLVHGPFTCTMLVEALRTQDKRIKLMYTLV
jgi:3-methylfumaryl-CoA hydratase